MQIWIFKKIFSPSSRKHPEFFGVNAFLSDENWVRDVSLAIRLCSSCGYGAFTDLITNPLKFRNFQKASNFTKKKSSNIKASEKLYNRLNTSTSCPSQKTFLSSQDLK